MKKKDKKLEDKRNSEELKIPAFVSLREKYKCDKCKLCRNNTHYYSFPKNLINVFANCAGNPCKRTQCPKRTYAFSGLFDAVTGIIILFAFLTIFSHLKDILLSLVYTLIFAVGMDIICCLIEYGVDKVFEGIEKSRKKKYDKKIAGIEAINQAKRLEEEKQKEKEEAAYKDINDAKALLKNLSEEYLSRIEEAAEKQLTKERKKKLLKSYKALLTSIDELLDHINLDNFYFSEIKVFFQIHLPKLREYLVLYLESLENEKETDSQFEELLKLFEIFNSRATMMQENLKNSDAESLIYKMQALREVVSRNSYEEDKK